MTTMITKTIARGSIREDGTTCDLAWCDPDGSIRGEYREIGTIQQVQALLDRESVQDYTIVVDDPDSEGLRDFTVIVADYEIALVKAGAAWSVARTVERTHAQQTYDAIVDYCAHGGTEVNAARLAGVDRMTVRKALGKR